MKEESQLGGITCLAYVNGHLSRENSWLVEGLLSVVLLAKTEPLVLQHGFQRDCPMHCNQNGKCVDPLPLCLHFFYMLAQPDHSVPSCKA